MAKKRADGEGNIRKRTNHSWEASVKVDDKRRYLYGKSQKEVRKNYQHYKMRYIMTHSLMRVT